MQIHKQRGCVTSIMVTVYWTDDHSNRHFKGENFFAAHSKSSHGRHSTLKGAAQPKRCGDKNIAPSLHSNSSISYGNDKSLVPAPRWLNSVTCSFFPWDYVDHSRVHKLKFHFHFFPYRPRCASSCALWTPVLQKETGGLSRDSNGVTSCTALHRSHLKRLAHCVDI